MNPKAGNGRSNREIYSAALEIVEPEARQAYLDQACGTDTRRREQIEQLLAAHAIEQPNALDKVILQLGPAGTWSSESDKVERVPPSPPPKIERYKIREQIGEGGMGIVYVAEQTTPVRRNVALKIIKPGMHSVDVIARFEAERQALALMDHPNIARVLDGATLEDGRPYFAMELVQGVPITEFCDANKSPNRERLQLFIDVCSAVQHAHQKGIIHRDLKPSNIMVTMNDDQPMPKVIDFGIAKALSQPLTENSIYTAYGQMIGTPLYMSPEQAQFNAVDVDTRSDVYSLGVLLYKLLTGSTPFDKKVLHDSGLDEMRRLIREVDPPRPSHHVSTLKAEDSSTVSARRSTDPRKLSQSLTGELDWIVMQALEKKRDRRYQSARDLAADVQRYLNDEPVLACPPTIAYRIQKYSKRYRGLLTTAALLLVTMMGGTAASLWYASMADQAARDAQAAQTNAETQADKANKLAVAAAQAAAETEKANVREAAQRKRAEQALYVSDVRLASSQVKSGSHSEAFDSLLRQYPREADDDYRFWEWYYLIDQANQSLHRWQAHDLNISAIDWSPDGKRIATTSNDGSVAIWDAETGTEIHRLTEGITIKNGVDWHPHNHQLAWGNAADESVVRIWDENSDTIEMLGAKTNSIWSVHWSHDGDRIAVGAIPHLDPNLNPDDKNFVIWTQVDGSWRIQSRVFIPYNITSAVWNFDDTQVAVSGEHGHVEVYDAETLKLIYQTPDINRISVHWHPNRNQLAFSSVNGECIIFDAENFTERTRFVAHAGTLIQLQWSPSGEHLATCGSDGYVKIWNTADWSLSNTFSRHVGFVNDISWHFDSKKLASVGFDGAVNIWPVTNRNSHFQLDATDAGLNNHFAWTTEQSIRMMSGTGAVVDRNPRTGEIERTIDLPDTLGSWGLRGKNLVSRTLNEGEKNKLDFYTIDALTGFTKVASDISFPSDGATHCAINDSKQIAVNLGGYARTTVFDLPLGNERELGAQKFILVNQMAWSPDLNTIAIVGHGLESDEGNPKYAAWLHLVDPKTRMDISHTRVGRYRTKATAVGWSPDSRRVVAASRDGTCEIFDSQDQHKLVSRNVHRSRVNTVSWHPDGTRIASGGDDQTVNIWDSASAETVLKLPVNDVVAHVEWSPDGNMLAAQEMSGTIHIWDATTGLSFAGSKNLQQRLSSRIQHEFRFACESGDFPLARQHGKLLLNRDGIQSVLSYYYLGLLCVTEDGNLYRDVCERMLKHCTDSEISEDLFFTVWTCALAPDAIENYTSAVQLARNAIETEPGDQRHLNALGAILMRSSQNAESKIELEKALAADKSELHAQCYIHYFLAMAEHQLGNAQAAIEQLEIANQAADEELAGSLPWNRKLTFKLLREEAEMLIGNTTGK